MSQTSELPTGWARASLSQAARIIPGQSPPGASYNVDGRGLPFLQGKAEFGPLIPTPAKWCTEPKKIAEAGDVLVSVRAPVGPTNLADQEYAIGRGLAAIRPTNGIPSRYLLYALRATEHRLREHSTGTTFEAISANDLRRHEILLAPEGERDDIVTAIEQQSSRIDAAQADLLRVLQSLDVLRRSIVVDATSGRLVPLEADRGDQGQYESAQEFVRRCSAARIGTGRRRARSSWIQPTKPLPEGWTWAQLRDLGELDRGRSRHRPRNDPRLYGGPYPFVQTGDIRRSMGTIRRHSQTYNEMGLAQSRLWPAGTLCITIAANIAETAILDYPACFPDSVVGFVHDGDPGTNRYVQLCIQTMKQRLWELAPATAQKNINLGTLEDIAIPLPPPSEQVRIVAEVDRMMELADFAEAEARAALRRSEGLRASVLTWALTPEMGRAAT